MIKKIPYIAYHIIEKIKKLKSSNKKETIKTWSRSSTILPFMIGYTINIYNGKKHIPLYISSELIGYKLGEFSFTRTFTIHKDQEQIVDYYD